MTIEQSLDQFFRGEAVRAIAATGAYNVTDETIVGNPLLRAQFRAMLVDARVRFDPQGENHAAIVRLIHECDSASEREPASMPTPRPAPGMILGAGGTGFQMARLEEPGPKPLKYPTLDELRESVDDDRR